MASRSSGSSKSNGASSRRSESASAALSDRRRHPRIPHRANFDIRPLLANGVGTPISVVLQDMSSSGLGILHSTPLYVGDQFQIPLTRELPAGEKLSLVCTCVRCEKLDEGLYSVGFEFNSSSAAVDEGSRQLTGKPVRRD
jgi:hypothetical protein